MKEIEEYKQELRGWVETRDRQQKNNNAYSVNLAQQEINRLQAIIRAMERRKSGAVDTAPAFTSKKQDTRTVKSP